MSDLQQTTVPWQLARQRAGKATCPICHEAVRPDDDAVLTPGFIADDTDPLYPFADAVMHRACFFCWDPRKHFVSRYNRVARRLTAQDGSYPFMTNEGAIIRRRDTRPSSHWQEA